MKYIVVNILVSGRKSREGKVIAKQLLQSFNTYDDEDDLSHEISSSNDEIEDNNISYHEQTMKLPQIPVPTRVTGDIDKVPLMVTSTPYPAKYNTESAINGEQQSDEEVSIRQIKIKKIELEGQQIEHDVEISGHKSTDSDSPLGHRRRRPLKK